MLIAPDATTLVSGAEPVRTIAANTEGQPAPVAIDLETTQSPKKAPDPFFSRLHSYAGGSRNLSSLRMPPCEVANPNIATTKMNP